MGTKYLFNRTSLGDMERMKKLRKSEIDKRKKNPNIKVPPPGKRTMF